MQKKSLSRSGKRERGMSSSFSFLIWRHSSFRDPTWMWRLSRVGEGGRSRGEGKKRVEKERRKTRIGNKWRKRWKRGELGKIKECGK